MDLFFFSPKLCPVLHSQLCVIKLFDLCHVVEQLTIITKIWFSNKTKKYIIIRSYCFFSLANEPEYRKSSAGLVSVFVCNVFVRVFVSKRKQHVWIIGLLVVVSIHGYLSYTFSTRGPLHHPLIGIMFLNLAAFQRDGPERVCVRNVESLLPEASCLSCPLLTQSNKITLQLQHWKKLATNKEILYTKWQLIKLWADM